MMNKYSTDTLILFIFTINVLSLVFLGDNSPILGLFNKLISIAGLSWIINFYYKIQEDSLFLWLLNQPNDSTLFIVRCQERSDSLFFQKDTLKQGKIRIIPIPI